MKKKNGLCQSRGRQHSQHGRLSSYLRSLSGSKAFFFLPLAVLKQITFRWQLILSEGSEAIWGSAWVSVLSVLSAQHDFQSDVARWLAHCRFSVGGRRKVLGSDLTGVGSGRRCRPLDFRHLIIVLEVNSDDTLKHNCGGVLSLLLSIDFLKWLWTSFSLRLPD